MHAFKPYKTTLEVPAMLRVDECTGADIHIVERSTTTLFLNFYILLTVHHVMILGK